MRARAPLAASLAAVASLGLHGAGLIVVGPTEPETIAGGPAQIAMLGNSFEDAAAGVVTGATDPEALDAATEPLPVQPPTPVDASEVATVEPDSAAPPPEPTQTATAEPDATEPVATPQTPAVTAPAIANVAPVLPSAPATAPSEALSVATASSAPAAAKTAQTAPQSAPPSPVTPVAATAPRPEIERVEALDDPVVRTPDAATPRPQPRPDPNAAPPPARPSPEPAPQRRQQTAEPTQTTRQPPPQGNAAANSRAGQASGQAQGNARQSAQGGTGQSASDGRAAARYPQLVNRHLSRLRRPNARFGGAAVIAFTISGNGGLSSVSVARSSGNAEFDRIAIAHVRRAAPFPAPPAGAQRSYNVRVEGRS